MEEVKLTLAQKLLAIQKEIGTIAKAGRNEFQSYDYATEYDFVVALRPLLNKFGVLVLPEILDVKVADAGKDGKSKLTTLIMNYKFINADDATDYFVARVAGQGQDNGDKGIYKAITGAKKYFISNSFMIATGDDPEKDSKFTERPQGKTKLKAAEDF